MNVRTYLAGKTKRFYLLLIFSVLCVPSFAQGLKVAVAANLQSVITVLQKDFKQKTDIDIDPIAGSSGKLVAQIKNGAPFDVFLSADMSFPQSLFQDGFSAKEPVVYAYGSLIICSTRNIGFENWERTMLTPRIKKIAIANPSVAPYGLAAQEMLKKKGVLDNVKSKMVYGESISQINTYITTGVVDVGFTTQALIKDPANKTILYWKLIDPKEYTPIKQGIVVLKHGETNPEAEKFYRYILSKDAKRIFEQYGYRVQ